MSKIDFYNVKMDILNTEETLKVFEGFLQSGSPKSVFFINAHCFNIAQKNDEYRKVINDADLLLNDGIGIKLGASLLGQNVKENMNGTDFIPVALEFAAKKNLKVYFLGAGKGVAESAKSKIEKKIKGLNIVGVHDGYFDDAEETKIIKEINEKKADMLIVGMGVPKQELWVSKNMGRFETVKISIAGGAILDFMAERFKRAPVFMQKSGLEWLFRLSNEPKRLFKRYAVGIPVFFYYAFKLKGKS